jgi:hypothetical protein
VCTQQNYSDYFLWLRILLFPLFFFFAIFTHTGAFYHQIEIVLVFFCVFFCVFLPLIPLCLLSHLQVLLVLISWHVSFDYARDIVREGGGGVRVS